jgi:WD40 repeat protein
VRLIKKAVPLMVLALVGGQISATASDVPPYRGSANLELVAQIPGSGGTDLEFFTRELRVWRDWYGYTHTVPDGEPPVTRHFAMVGNQSAPGASGPMTGGAKIVDITNPQIPFIASAIQDCAVGQGDIQVTKGGTVAAIAWQTGSGQNKCSTWDGQTLTRGSILVDLSDVYDPLVIAGAKETSGSHNQTIHPSGDYLYISTSSGSGNIPIYDISDPANPVKVKKWAPPSGNNPHDIRFSDDGTRAYMAGIGQFRIVDTTDPTDPKVISTFTVPGSTIGHDVLVTPDKAFLFAGDELNGGGTAPCPGGAVYVYDIRGANEANPVLLGIVEAGAGPVTGRNNDEAGVNPVSTSGCTSHVMDLNPDKKSFTIGWYQAGTRVFDFSGLYDASGNPAPTQSIRWGAHGHGPVKEIGWIVPQGANTWSAKQYAGVPGYIFSDDLVLGLYVTKIK